MYCESSSDVNGNPAMGSSSIPSHSGDPQNFVDSNDKHISLEYDDGEEESSFDEVGMFGDFCLMCGEMMIGECFQGKAYCSEECEYHQSLTSESDWCDLSLEGYQLPSYGGSTTVSSAKTSPLNSPNLQASGRLAILCSGPPPCELLLPLDLGERLLGAKAVAERYLEKRPESWQDDGEGDGEKQDADALGEDEETVKLDWKSINSTITPPQKALASRGPHLKSRPALAQLTDLQGHLTDSEFGKQQQMMSSQPGSPHSLSLIELPLLSSSSAISKKPSIVSNSSRRVSDPAHQPSKSISVSPPDRQLYHSSFSLTSLSSLSPSSQDGSSYFD